MFYMGAAWSVLRPFARELGRRLVEAGTLATPNDVFFLRFVELEEATRARHDRKDISKLLEIAAERRVLREARKRLHPPESIGTPPFWVKTNTEPEDTHETGNTLSGAAVSPGTVTAEVSLIRSIDEFSEMKPGTILVCPTTTPAWTQLFAHASGLATDIGGILAHGSIVAREYGIPAVLGLGDITKRVRSGQRITVDGDSGTVTIRFRLMSTEFTEGVD